MLASLVWVGFQYFISGHLPHPFHADPFESQMDFYNTAYWANRSGAYTVWHTVYPPLTFLLSQGITDHGCYMSTPHAARACDPTAAWWIVGVYVANIAIVFLALWRSNKPVAIPRTLALCFGLPMLYGLELANFIIPCFTVFVLAEGRLPLPAWLRFLCLGLAINFKPYLLAIAVPRVLSLSWRWCLSAGLSCLVIYLITLALYRSGTPAQIVTDLLIYAGGQSGIYAETNHLALITDKSHGAWRLFMPLLLRSGEIAALVALVLARRARTPSANRRCAALAMSVICTEAALHTDGFSADYTQIFLIFLIFMETDWNRITALVIGCAYLLCVSSDLTLIHAYKVFGVSYFSGRTVELHFGLAMSQFVRPALLVLIQAGLLAMVWRDRNATTFIRTS